MLQHEFLSTHHRETLLAQTFTHETELPQSFPVFPGGSTEERLRNFTEWVDVHAPALQFTHRQIASAVGLSRQSIQDVERHALRKLRLKNPIVAEFFSTLNQWT